MEARQQRREATGAPLSQVPSSTSKRGDTQYRFAVLPEVFALKGHFQKKALFRPGLRVYDVSTRLCFQHPSQEVLGHGPPWFLVFHCRPQYAPDARQMYLAARGHGARRPHRALVTGQLRPFEALGSHLPGCREKHRVFEQGNKWTRSSSDR